MEREAGNAEVLIVGQGGRESALKQAIKLSPEVGRVAVSADVEAGLALLSEEPKPLVVVGPEVPLIDGLADDLRSKEFPVFGVSKTAARYEASKSEAVNLMRKYHIPHPMTLIFPSGQKNTALDYTDWMKPYDWVIKADEVAAGKAVVLPKTKQEMIETITGMFDGSLFDGAGKDIVNMQKRRSGSEISATMIVGDNDEFYMLPPAQDHKRLGEGDSGPNTGGMGSYCPVPESILSQKQYAQIYEIGVKSLKAMRAEGTPFERGVLYMGIMLSQQNNNDPLVLEYNVRFGDPETQALMAWAKMAGLDIYKLLRSAAEGDLIKPEINEFEVAASGISFCLAAKGYPEDPHTGDQIYGLDKKYPGVDLHYAAVKDGKTNGGRVMYSTAAAPTIQQAAGLALGAIDLKREGPKSGKVGFDGMQVRKDIAHQVR